VQGRPRADTAYTPIKNDTESEHIISFIFSPLPSFCFQENSLAVKLESEEADGDSAKKKIEEDHTAAKNKQTLINKQITRFIPLPRFMRSRRPTPLLAPSLVFSPLRSA
jgi:hypothetical protein